MFGYCLHNYTKIGFKKAWRLHITSYLSNKTKGHASLFYGVYYYDAFAFSIGHANVCVLRFATIHIYIAITLDDGHNSDYSYPL